MTAVPSEVAGRYRLGKTLGEGGMGRVWLARDEVLQRDVAVKEILLPPDLVAAERDSVHRRTVQEARAAARLSHPGVAQVYDVLEEEGRAWIVMEYVPSRSLQEVIRDDGPQDPRRVAEMGLDLLSALEAAHSSGVRHRDVKPANVLLGDDGRVVLTDFGIATIDGDSIITTTNEVVLGSPQYMAPERATDGTALPGSDLWSLGATLYAAVEGRPPYERPGAMATLTALASEPPDPPQRAGVLGPVLDGLLQKDPATRIDTAEARQRLELAAAEPEAPTRRLALFRRSPAAPAAAAPAVDAPAVDAPAAEAPPARHRRRYVLAGSLAAVLLAAGGLVWAGTERDGTTQAAVEPPAVPSRAPSSAPALPPAPSSSSLPSSSAAPSSVAFSSVPPPSSAPASSPAAGGLPVKPAGWRDYKDKSGFAVYVPEGWQKSVEKTRVYFRGDGRTLGIDQTDTPQPDPVADWEGKAEYRVSIGDFPDYDEIHIKPVDYFVKAADWEFTFGGGGSRRHVNNRGVITSEKQAYGFWWETSESDWAGARDDLQLIFDSFRPAS